MNLLVGPPLPVALGLQGTEKVLRASEEPRPHAGMLKSRTSGPTPAPGRPPSLEQRALYVSKHNVM